MTLIKITIAAAIFGIAVLCLIKAPSWLKLDRKAYHKFLWFVGIMFIVLLTISTFVFIILNPEILEQKNITITRNTEYNDIYNNNLSELLDSEAFGVSSNSSSAKLNSSS